MSLAEELLADLEDDEPEPGDDAPQQMPSVSLCFYTVIF